MVQYGHCLADIIGGQWKVRQGTNATDQGHGEYSHTLSGWEGGRASEGLAFQKRKIKLFPQFFPLTSVPGIGTEYLTNFTVLS